MFCCFAGNTKRQPEPNQELAVNLKNKRPQDFMKDPIPLSLSENIAFRFVRDKHWNAQISGPERTEKRGEPEELARKLKQTENKLKEARERQSELEHKIQQQKKLEEETALELARMELNAKAIELLIANEIRQIYRYQEKVRPNQA